MFKVYKFASIGMELSDRDVIMAICPYKAMVDKVRDEGGSFYFALIDSNDSMNVDMRIGHLPDDFGTSDDPIKRNAYETFVAFGCDRHTYVVYENKTIGIVDIRAYEM